MKWILCVFSVCVLACAQIPLKTHSDISESFPKPEQQGIPKPIPLSKQASSASSSSASSSPEQEVKDPVRAEIPAQTAVSSDSVAVDLARLSDILSGQESLLQSLFTRISLLEQKNQLQESGAEGEPSLAQQVKDLSLQIESLRLEIEALKPKPKSKSKPSKSSKSSKPAAKSSTGAAAASSSAPKVASPARKKPFAAGEQAFSEKKWAEAIEFYQTYRKRYPSGKRYVQATYKIALSFMSAGDKTSARPFVEELVSRFPNSEQAKKLQKHL